MTRWGFAAGLVLFGFILCAGLAVARNERTPGPHIYDLTVLPHDATIDEAVAGGGWRSLQDAPPNLAGNWWARFRLDLGPLNRAWSLYLGERVSTELFDRRGALVARTGDAVPYGRRVPAMLVPSLPLPSGYRSGDLLYLHITGKLRNIANLHSVPTEQLDSLEREFWTQFVLVAGVLGGLGVLRLIVGLRLRDAASLAYTASSLGFIIYEAVDVRVGWAIFWPGLSIAYEPAWNAALIVFLLGRTAFIRLFVPLARLAPLAYRLFLAGIGVTIATAGVEIFGTFSGSGAVIGCAALVAFVSAFAGIAVCAQKGSREARFSLVAFAGFAPFALSTVLSNQLHVLPPNWIFDHGIEIGICLEAVLLSFGLADRVHSADRARIEAQQQALEIARLHNEAVSRFLPSEFIVQLGRADVTELALGDHVLQRMTVLFADIRSFTTLSESMTPDENFRFLNAYLSQLGPVIREHRGFIDKYIGDGIMGLFPGPADDGIRAAVALQHRLSAFNEERNRAGFAPIRCGVGVHRGDLRLGTIGEAERMDTTVIADVVNLASRIEGLTKLYGARVLVSQSVAAELHVPGSFALRDLGTVTAKGKSAPTRVLEVLDADDETLRAAKLANLVEFERALGAFTAGRFGTAHEEFAAISARCPGDAAAAHYSERSRELLDASPADWDGIDHMLVK
jgi:class 3 adenylate cyclase